MSVLQPVVFANYYGRAFIGTIQGTMRPLLGISQLAGPLLVAMVFDATGTFDVAFLACVVVGLVAAAIALLATPPTHKDTR